MDVLKLICFILTIVGCIMVLSYSGMATKKGWPMGKMFVGGSIFTILSGILLLAVIIFCFQFFSWWKAILIIIGAWLIAGVLTVMLRSASQVTALALIVTGVIIYIISFSTVI